MAKQDRAEIQAEMQAKKDGVWADASELLKQQDVLENIQCHKATWENIY